MTKTNDAGIDYSRGQTNIDFETGIRYGVISQNDVLQAWADESDAWYGEPHCPQCGNAVIEGCPDSKEDYQEWEDNGGDYLCEDCKASWNSEDCFGEEPVSFDYEQDGYAATQAGDDTDIFILKSPYFTYAQFCSPCAPGAGHLGNPMSPDQGVKTYCFGHEWFEDQETGKEIKCQYCHGTGKRLVNKEPVNLTETGTSEYVVCWGCNGRRKRKEMVRKAPYPVYSVETGELIEPTRD